MSDPETPWPVLPEGCTAEVASEQMAAVCGGRWTEKPDGVTTAEFLESLAERHPDDPEKPAEQE